MPSTLFNAEELQQYILRRLGAPQVDVNLTQEDLDLAIYEAKRWFSAKKGFKGILELPISSNQTEYELPDHVDTVIDVALPSSPTDFSRVIDPLGLLDASIPYNLFPAPQAGGLFSTYAQALQYLELSKRITGGEIEWEQRQRTLFIFPRPKEPGTAVVFFKQDDFTIEQLDSRDHDMVKRWALAWAKEKLGYSRVKYEGYPGAQGAISIDSQRLIQEAQAEMLALDEELFESGFPMGFLTG